MRNWLRQKTKKKKNIEESDLIGFGSGIYFGQHHKSILAALDAFRNVSGEKAFVFSTAGFPAGKFMFHRALKKELAKSVCNCRGYPCKGFDTCKIFGSVGGMDKVHPDGRDPERPCRFCTKRWRQANH